MSRPLLAKLSNLAEYVVMPGTILAAYFVAHEPGSHEKKDAKKK